MGKNSRKKSKSAKKVSTTPSRRTQRRRFSPSPTRTPAQGDISDEDDDEVGTPKKKSTKKTWSRIICSSTTSTSSSEAEDEEIDKKVKHEPMEINLIESESDEDERKSKLSKSKSKSNGNGNVLQKSPVVYLKDVLHSGKVSTSRSKSKLVTPVKRKRVSDDESDLEENDIGKKRHEQQSPIKQKIMEVDLASEDEAEKEENEPELVELDDEEIQAEAEPDEEQQPAESSASSESASDAEVELNPVALDHEQDDPILDIVYLDDARLAERLQNVPILEGNSRSLKLEIRVHSKSEFSVEMYTEHHTTLRRTQKYPSGFIEELSQLNVNYWRFDEHEGRFIFTLSEGIYKIIMDALRIYNQPRCPQLPVPDPVLEDVIHAIASYYPANQPGYVDLYEDRHSVYMEMLEELGRNSTLSLLPYQKKVISFAIGRGGRCMFADDRRMGKRVESIFSAYFYRKEWPMIIICPTAFQDTWKSELVKWLPPEDGHEYEILNLKLKEDCEALAKASTASPDIIIIGYKLLTTKEAKALKNFNLKVMILDQSHRIKHAWTATAKSAVHIIKRSRRRFLLTSNPAFGVPIELFRQLRVINRKCFKEYQSFAYRYCGMTEVTLANGQTVERASTKWSDAKNLEELGHLLFGTVAIRNHREDLQNGNIKLREKVLLNFNPDERTRRILGNVYTRSQIDLEILLNKDEIFNSKIFVWYRKSGSAKLMEICKYLDGFGLEKRKTIIYARHKDVMEGIEKLLRAKEIQYVRIKGNYDERKELSESFNKDKDIKVALLNMNISDKCVNLHSANTIVFTEFYWVPDSLVRNEDRAFKLFYPHKVHRKKKKVEIKYLIAKDNQESEKFNQIHIDTHLWELLSGKMNVLEKLGLVSSDFTFTMPEEEFIPEPSSVIDDLTFSDMSSGAGSEGEYLPGESGDESGGSDEDDSLSGSPAHSEDFSSFSDNENSDCVKVEPKKSKEDEDDENEVKVDVELDDPEEDPETDPVPASNIGRRLTRSQTVEARAQQDYESDKDSDENDQDESGKENENSHSSDDSVSSCDNGYKTRGRIRGKCDRIDSESEISSDSDSSLGSLKDFVEGPLESEEDMDYIPKKKKKKTKKLKRKRERERRNSNGSDNEEDRVDLSEMTFGTPRSRGSGSKNDKDKDDFSTSSDDQEEYEKKKYKKKLGLSPTAKGFLR